jgi:hypothetical protein
MSAFFLFECCLPLNTPLKLANGSFAVLDFGCHDYLDSNLRHVRFKLPGIMILPGRPHGL